MASPLIPPAHQLLTSKRWPALAVMTTIIWLLLTAGIETCRADTKFPIYPEIQPSVQFWEKIYGKHSLNTAVIHDRDDLAKVYEIVSLPADGTPRANRKSSQLLKQARNSYASILRKLSRGGRPSSAKEKRVASMFSGTHARKKMAKAAGAVRIQAGQKERFTQGVVRSGAYINEIKKIFIKHGLPTELAYLPHVESSYNPQAYSKFGAAGIWQFTRATGKRYMLINDAVDERRDPLIAAEAAAKYLKNSYRKLGSWPLAITAYNYGLSGTMRAKRAKGSYAKIFRSYRQGHFGFASRNFYSEFVAAYRVAQRLEQDTSLKKNRRRQTFDVVMPGFIGIDTLARHYGISVSTLKHLNPALRPPVYAGKKLIPRGYTLHLPVRKNIRSRAASFPRSAYAGSQRKSPYYRVKKGDTAGGIARKNKISLKQLREANSLDRNGAIYIGQKLRIPSKSGSKSKYIPFLAAVDSKRLTGLKIPTTDKTTVSVTAPPPILSGGKKHYPGTSLKRKTSGVTGKLAVKEGGKRGKIIVHPEETLALYAQWLKIPEDMLRRINGLNSMDRIQPGRSLTLSYAQVNAARFAEQRAAFASENEEDFFSAYAVTGVEHYTVQRGDSLWDLCNKKFNIPLWLLKKYNTELDYRRISISQELRIPIVQSL